MSVNNEQPDNISENQASFFYDNNGGASRQYESIFLDALQDDELNNPQITWDTEIHEF